MINICVPVLRRYDLLRRLVLSLNDSIPRPDMLCVVNNGMDGARLRMALEGASMALDVLTPNKPMGVAESWNWFIQNFSEERVIVNDDIEFAPDSLARLLTSKADLAWAAGCGFACYAIRDSCVAKLGLFDETISPGYGYYEDDDYLQRLDGRGTRAPSAVAENVECGVRHFHSGTLKAASHEEVLEHHRRFKVAQANYMRKWGLELVNGEIVQKAAFYGAAYGAPTP